MYGPQGERLGTEKPPLFLDPILEEGEPTIESVSEAKLVCHMIRDQGSNTAGFTSTPWTILTQQPTFMVNNQSAAKVFITNAKRSISRRMKVTGRKRHDYTNNIDYIQSPIQSHLYSSSRKPPLTKVVGASFLSTDSSNTSIQWRMSEAGRLTGVLPCGQECKLLIDTGATTTVVNQRSIDAKASLSRSRVIIDVQTVQVRIASGQIMSSNKWLLFSLTIQGHQLQVLALVLPLDSHLDLVIGMKTMIELEANIMMPELTVNFPIRISPCIIREVQREGHLWGVTEDLAIHIQLTGEHSALTGRFVFRYNCRPLPDWQTTLIYFGKGKAVVRVIGRTVHMPTFKTGQILGWVDLRSVGYYKIPDAVFKHMKKGEFTFLSLENVLAGETKEDKPTIADQDPYPWLDKDDPRRVKTDEQILKEAVNLSESALDDQGKRRMMDLMLKYKKAFSIRDEIGECPRLRIHLQLTDHAPFYKRPYPAKPEEKMIIDREMKRLVSLGVLKKGMSGYSSPIMLVPRKESKIPRVVTDFRHLNTKLVRLNVAFPLVRDTLQVLGDSKCEVVSVIDLRDAYHTLRLDDESKQYCGIIPYYGSDSYLYQRLGMGLSVSPAIWQTFINYILDSIEEKDHHIAIMDDCLIYSDYASHMKHLAALFSSLIRHGLKISPRKCQFFRKHICYMGSTISVTPAGITFKVLRSRIEAIQELKVPTNVKECRMFCGMVNFIAAFVPHLRDTLIPIYELTKKNRPFIWTPMAHQAFVALKEQLTRAPVLYMPNSTDRFQLYSDTSHYATGAALYQVQGGLPRLIGYASKKLLPAVRNYTITELELFGLKLNIEAFQHLLGRVEFDAVVDHSALVYIIKAHKEPATTRIKRLLEELQGYTFRLYHIKGKDMIPGDFLSRYPREGDVTTTNTPIMCVMTRSMVKRAKGEQVQTKAPRGCTQPNCLGCRLDQPSYARRSNTPGGENSHRLDNKVTKVATKAPEGSREATMTQSHSQTIRKPADPLAPRGDPKGDNVSDHRRETLAVPGIGGPVAPTSYLPIGPKVVTMDRQSVSPMGKEYLVEPLRVKVLPEAVEARLSKLPKQVDIEPLVQKLRRKHLIDTHLNVSGQTLRNAYIASEHRELYRYLVDDILPGQKRKQLQILAKANWFVVIDGFMFHISVDTTRKAQLRLVVPEQLSELVFHVYHNTLLGGHQGITRTYYTIRQHYYIDNLFANLQGYVMACHECQLADQKRDRDRKFNVRIPKEYRPMTYLSCDIKHMPRTEAGFRYLFVVTCDITGFVLVCPLKELTGPHLSEALLQTVIWIFGPPEQLVIDEERALSGQVMMRVYETMRINVKSISPYNHGSLITERYIQSISNSLIKYLDGTGDQWVYLVKLVCYALNSFISPSTGFSPYELVFGRQPPPLIYNMKPVHTITTTYKEYHESLLARFKLHEQVVMQKKVERQERENQGRKTVGYARGALVYLVSPRTSLLQTQQKKFNVDYIGPVVVHQVLDPCHYLLANLEGNTLKGVYHFNRLKQAYLRVYPQGTVTTLPELRAAWAKAGWEDFPISQAIEPDIDVSMLEAGSSFNHKLDERLYCNDPNLFSIALALGDKLPHH